MLRRTLYHCAATPAGVVAAVAAASPAAAVEPQILAVYALPVIIANITNWIIGLAAGIATLCATYGAVRRMTANGDMAKIEQSNTAFRNAFLGYALALLTPIGLTIVQSWIGA